jgi:hypothetical protein
MRLKLVFDVPAGGWTALHCGRLFCDVQHLCLFAMRLAEVPGVTGEFDFLDFESQKYEFMVIADTRDASYEFGKSRLTTAAVTLESFKFSSPPELEVAINNAETFKGRVTRVLESFKKIILLEAQEDKIRAETEVLRQTALSAALSNLEHVYRIAEKIPDLEERRIFIDHLRSAVIPFRDGRHPPLRFMEFKE